MKVESAWVRLCRVGIKLKMIIKIDGSLLLHNGTNHYDALILLSWCQSRPLQFLQAIISILVPPEQCGIISTFDVDDTASFLWS